MQQYAAAMGWTLEHAYLVANRQHNAPLRRRAAYLRMCGAHHPFDMLKICTRESGHKGSHSNEVWDPSTPALFQTLCGSQHALGLECKRRANHFGPHSSSKDD